jgi:hypothetical protein
VRLSRILFLIAVSLLLIATSALGQTQPGPENQPQPQYQPEPQAQPEPQYQPEPQGQPEHQAQPQPQMPPPQSRVQPRDWCPQAVEDLGQTASSRTDFSFDHSMLVLASKVDDDDLDLRRVIAGIDGVSVHRFRFQGYGMYDPAILSAVHRQYQAAGWQHVSVAHAKDGGPGETDLWLHFEHNTIRNIAVLVAGRNQVNFVSVSGSISPIDLMHLGGHFGIPRIEGGVTMPAPSPAYER